MAYHPMFSPFVLACGTTQVHRVKQTTVDLNGREVVAWAVSVIGTFDDAIATLDREAYIEPVRSRNLIVRERVVLVRVADVVKALGSWGMTLRKIGGEYCVRFRGSNSLAYFTFDVVDAWQTARAERKWLDEENRAAKNNA